MYEKVIVEFSVSDKEKFLVALTEWDQSQERKADSTGAGNYCLGFRHDEALDKRVPLKMFVDAMEVKLRKNEFKTTWREKPIEALVRLMILELEEFKVALEFFSVKEARAETPDIANFAMMLHDRLGMLDQTKNAGEQIEVMK